MVLTYGCTAETKIFKGTQRGTSAKHDPCLSGFEDSKQVYGEEQDHS